MKGDGVRACGGSGGLDTLQLTLVAAEKVLQTLLSSHQGKRLTLHAGCWLLNTALCVVMAEALKAVNVRVNPSYWAGVALEHARFLTPRKMKGTISGQTQQSLNRKRVVNNGFTAFYVEAPTYTNRLVLTGRWHSWKFQWTNVWLGLEERITHRVQQRTEPTGDRATLIVQLPVCLWVADSPKWARK